VQRDTGTDNQAQPIRVLWPLCFNSVSQQSGIAKLAAALSVNSNEIRVAESASLNYVSWKQRKTVAAICS
jgi:hypothetical protein